jgi:hypothetical protein
MKPTKRTPLSYRLWPKHPEDILRDYGKLHDGLSDMIESGRLTEAHIPDDYQWLVATLTKLGAEWGIHPDSR